MAIASPCIKVCTIDTRSNLCRGCGRTLDEIARWMSFSDSERSRIMGRAAAAGSARGDLVPWHSSRPEI